MNINLLTQMAFQDRILKQTLMKFRDLKLNIMKGTKKKKTQLCQDHNYIKFNMNLLVNSLNGKL